MCERWLPLFKQRQGVLFVFLPEMWRIVNSSLAYKYILRFEMKAHEAYTYIGISWCCFDSLVNGSAKVKMHMFGPETG